MTIDERLEKVTEGLERLQERHDALSQTVELMARENASLQAFVREVAEGTARLLNIARIPEQRSSRLEGQE